MHHDWKEIKPWTDCLQLQFEYGNNDCWQTKLKLFELKLIRNN